MKISRLFILAGLLLTVAACGSSSSSGGTTPAGDTVTLTGTLGTGSITPAGLKSTTAAASYRVVAVDNSRNKTYRSTTGTDGSFSLDVPADGTYLVSYIDSNGRYAGPTVFENNTTSVVTGITPTEDSSLGTITFDSDSGYAQTESTPSFAASSVTSVASSGRPFGAGNDGKTQNEDITADDLRDDMDEDQDGIPNIFDADENNDNIRNGILDNPSSATVVSDNIESVYMTSNIWAVHGGATETSEELTQVEKAMALMALRLHVVPLSGRASMISSVVCSSVPSSVSGSATMRWASSLGVPEADYPEEGTTWLSNSYNLYEATESTNNEWIVSIAPNAEMNVGDTFEIRVTYTDSTYEDFFVIMPYVMTDWAKITTYAGTPLTDDVGKKTSGDQADFTGSSLTIIFAKPLDEDGNVLEGISYSVGYAESDCSSGTCNVPDTTTEPSVTDVSGATTLTYTIEDLGVATHYVVPIAEDNSQRNGEETWFTRTE